MLSLWLDRSSASLEELIPSHQQCAVDAEVDALITAIRRATDAAFLTEFASDGAANLATNEKNRNVAPATFIPSQHHSLDPALHEDRLRNLFAQGLFSLTVPRDCGGFDASLRDFAMCMEALGAMGPAWAMTAVPHLCISVKAVARYAEPRQRTTILNNIRDQHRLLAFAITEEQGSDVAAMRTRLQKSPNGGYRLSGRKQWITNLRRASHVVVACLCPDLHNAPGASVLVLVDLQQTGVNIAQPWRKVCVNGSDTSDIFFDHVEIAEDQILTKPGQGMNAFLEMVQPGRLGTMAASLGLARRALQTAQADLASSLTNETDRKVLSNNESALDAVSAAIRLCANFGDDKHYDFPHLVSLMKFISGEIVQQVLQELDHVYVCKRKQSPPTLKHHRDALGLFRLLKGPGEVLAWQTLMAWSAVVLEEMEDKPSWPSDLEQEARFLTTQILQLRRLGGPNQQPMLGQQLIRGLGYWWLMFSTHYLRIDAACDLASSKIEAAQAWAQQRFTRWRAQFVAMQAPLTTPQVEALFTRVSTSYEHLFKVRLELSA